MSSEDELRRSDRHVDMVSDITWLSIGKASGELHFAIITAKSQIQDPSHEDMGRFRPWLIS